MVEKSCQLCYLCSRLTKNVLKVSSNRISLFRRMNSAPVTMTETCSPGVDGKENSTSRVAALGGISPAKQCLSSSPRRRARTPFESHDSNSQDSGFSQEDQSFRFAEPSGLAPRKPGIESSPRKPFFTSPSSKTLSNASLGDGKLSFSSTSSLDDGFLDLNELDKSFPDENATEDGPPPAGLGILLTAQLINNAQTAKSSREQPEEIFTCGALRRSQSLVDYSPPCSSRTRVGLFRDDAAYSGDDLSPCVNSFKRPRDLQANTAKRRKSNSLQIITDNSPRRPKARYKLQRSISETAAMALASDFDKSYKTPDLIADFSRPYVLPLTSGRHQDLKSITSDTLAQLLSGGFSSTVNSFKIIDCRYPYEYLGGHIRGSQNLFTCEQIEKELFSSGEPPSNSVTTDKRDILVFHCEFSVERGPTMYRFLRKNDRRRNDYPSLNYPEVYLLHGGYESFFRTYKYLCDPSSYQPMLDPNYISDFKKFRLKSNSWSGDTKRPTKLSGLKRLAF